MTCGFVYFEYCRVNYDNFQKNYFNNIRILLSFFVETKTKSTFNIIANIKFRENKIF